LNSVAGTVDNRRHGTTPRRRGCLFKKETAAAFFLWCLFSQSVAFLAHDSTDVEMLSHEPYETNLKVKELEAPHGKDERGTPGGA
jgi:hypothetical protein